MAEKKRGLGAKGLGINALINTEVQDLKTAKSNETVTELDLDLIEPNRKQPRKYFDETALEELAASLKAYGMIQPIVVKKNGEYYEIIAGERRWRAAKIAGMEKVPVVLKAWEGSEAFEAALVENLQREDLNPLEEALGYRYMMDELKITQEQAAEKVGKSRPAVANALRLLKLPNEVQEMVKNNLISPGHARALLGFDSDDMILQTAKMIIKEDLSVRDVETLVKKSKKVPKASKKQIRDKFFSEVELALVENLGRKVKIKEAKQDAGILEIEFFDKDDLEGLAMKLENYGK